MVYLAVAKLTQSFGSRRPASPEQVCRAEAERRKSIEWHSWSVMGCPTAGSFQGLKWKVMGCKLLRFQGKKGKAEPLIPMGCVGKGVKAWPRKCQLLQLLASGGLCLNMGCICQPFQEQAL